MNNTMGAYNKTSGYKSGETKSRIIEKLDNSFFESTKLCQAIIKSSKSRETLNQSCKSIASVDGNIMNTKQHLKSIEMTLAKMQQQSRTANERLREIENLRNKLEEMQPSRTTR